MYCDRNCSCRYTPMVALNRYCVRGLNTRRYCDTTTASSCAPRITATAMLLVQCWPNTSSPYISLLSVTDGLQTVCSWSQYIRRILLLSLRVVPSSGLTFILCRLSCTHVTVLYPPPTLTIDVSPLLQISVSP